MIVAAGYAVGGISGGAFNPAVAIGLDVSSFDDGVQWCFAWTAVELLVAVLAVVLFHIVRPGEGMTDQVFLPTVSQGFLQGW